MRKPTLQQPESFLWEAADILRGNKDAPELKDLKHDLGSEPNTASTLTSLSLPNTPVDSVSQ